MEEKIKKLTKAIRNARRADSLMLTALIALALCIPISIIEGNWFNAFCNCLWIYIGVRWYKAIADAHDTSATAISLIVVQDRLINKLSELLCEMAKKQPETEDEGKEAEQ